MFKKCFKKISCVTKIKVILKILIQDRDCCIIVFSHRNAEFHSRGGWEGGWVLEYLDTLLYNVHLVLKKVLSR